MSIQDIFHNAANIAQQALGVDVTYSYLSGDPDSTIKGIFDNAWNDPLDIGVTRPVLTIVISDLTSTPVDGDTITISSVIYTVKEYRPDGPDQNTATLILQET